MGVAIGCGCKEVYRFPHTTYPYSSCICSFLQQHPYFLQQHPYFLFILLNVFFLLVLVPSMSKVSGIHDKPTIVTCSVQP